MRMSRIVQYRIGSSSLLPFAASKRALTSAIFLRTLNLIRRVYINQVNLHGILESLVNVGVIMNDRGRADTLKLTQVKLLNVFRGQGLEGNSLFAEVRCYNFFRGDVLLLISRIP